MTCGPAQEVDLSKQRLARREERERVERGLGGKSQLDVVFCRALVLISLREEVPVPV